MKEWSTLNQSEWYGIFILLFSLHVQISFLRWGWLKYERKAKIVYTVLLLHQIVSLTCLYKWRTPQKWIFFVLAQPMKVHQTTHKWKFFIGYIRKSWMRHKNRDFCIYATLIFFFFRAKEKSLISGRFE